MNINDYASIRITKNLRKRLQKLKTHPRETYGDIIFRLIKVKGGKKQ